VLSDETYGFWFVMLSSPLVYNLLACNDNYFYGVISMCLFKIAFSIKLLFNKVTQMPY
jgi:hypothetical protein